MYHGDTHRVVQVNKHDDCTSFFSTLHKVPMNIYENFVLAMVVTFINKQRKSRLGCPKDVRILCVDGNMTLSITGKVL